MYDIFKSDVASSQEKTLGNRIKVKKPSFIFL